MGAHEAPEATLDAVETDAIRLRAARLVAQYDDHTRALGPILDGEQPADVLGYMDRDAWLMWEGIAYYVLKELARG